MARTPASPTDSSRGTYNPPIDDFLASGRATTTRNPGVTDSGIVTEDWLFLGPRVPRVAPDTRPPTIDSRRTADGDVTERVLPPPAGETRDQNVNAGTSGWTGETRSQDPSLYGASPTAPVTRQVPPSVGDGAPGETLVGNQRGGPFGDATTAVGRNDAVSVTAGRDTGDARNPYDAHSVVVVTGPRGQSVRGEASSDVRPAEASASISVTGSNFSLTASGAADLLSQSANGTIELTIGGRSVIFAGSGQYDAGVVSLTLDPDPDTAGDETQLVFDTVNQLFAITGPDQNTLEMDFGQLSQFVDLVGANWETSPPATMLP